MARPLDSLAARLKAARAHMRLTQGQLAELVGLNQSDISKLERGSMRSTTAIARLASALHADAEWLELGGAQPPAWLPQDSTAKFLVQERVPPWPGVTPGLARQVSQQAIRIAPNLMTTEGVAAAMTSGTLPEIFTMPLPDAAIGHPGAAVLWARDWPPSPGQWILTATLTGALHARVYRQGKREGQWIAHAVNPDYASFISDEDGVRIVAARIGMLDESIESLQRTLKVRVSG